MNALNHWAERYECDACSDVFFDEDERDDHMNDLDHWRWDCETCSRQFASVGAQEQHMDALGHWKHYCKLCQRHFVNANNLRMVSREVALSNIRSSNSVNINDS